MQRVRRARILQLGESAHPLAEHHRETLLSFLGSPECQIFEEKAEAEEGSTPLTITGEEVSKAYTQTRTRDSDHTLTHTTSANHPPECVCVCVCV